MNVFTRGIRNAFRNSVRTLSIVVILGLSIGLSLTMLIAHQAVNTKIAQVKADVGNTVTISPAGYSGFSQVNNSLTASELNKLNAIDHVVSVEESLSDRLYTTGTSQPSFGGFGGGQSSSSSSSSTISLKTPVTLNTSNAGGRHFFVSGGNGSLPTSFSLPITILGTNDPTAISGSTVTIASGKDIDATGSSDTALVSQSMASKNGLSVGSTFTAYNTTITVAGIFKTSDQGTENTVVLPLATEQSLSGQSGDVTSATVTVDSLNNLSAVTTAVKNKLGSSADVTSSQEQANETVAPLNNVSNIALYSLIGSVVAGGVIILMTMIMIVRERKREIGVIKAIGGSNVRIMLQFMAEALTLTVLGAVIGLVIGFVAANPVTNTLVTNSTTSTTTTVTPGAGGRFGGPGGGGGSGFATSTTGGAFRASFAGHGAKNELHNIHAEVGWSILLYGFGAAILIAIIGSAIAAGLIAKVRPSEVMRAE